MRIRSLIKSDLRFQYKYGFCTVYLIVLIVYACLLYALPKEIRSDVAAVLILTDPAAMGLFFMGAILLLEKSQRVLNSIAVSPVTAWEYILSKAVSIGVLSVIVSIILAILGESQNILGVVVGTMLGSIFFTMIGLSIAVKVSSLNQFIIATMPVEIIGFVPAIAFMFGLRRSWMLLHPGCAMLELFIGKGDKFILCTVVLLCYCVAALFLSNHILRKMIRSIGGVTL